MSNANRSSIELPPGQLAPLEIDVSKAGIARGAAASIGKKYVMGWAGMLWSVFVLVHLLGNFTLFAGQDAYNSYSAKLLSLGPVLIIMEAGLVLLLVLHVVMGVWVTLENWGARPVKYEVDRSKGGRTVASSTMIWTGAIVLGFMILHLIDLKFGKHMEVDGKLDLYTSTVNLLSGPVYAIWYIVAVCFLGLHLYHALQSGFRTIGLNHDRYTPAITWISRAFGVFVAVGYSSIPIWAWLIKGGAQ
ncbi:MAG: succinate dehydrogenase cytochrome b subunit [Planctomycetota bacterium]|jgi:succinate dehydrogenase / fumarate reductase cytochrome b subunit